VVVATATSETSARSTRTKRKASTRATKVTKDPQAKRSKLSLSKTRSSPRKPNVATKKVVASTEPAETVGQAVAVSMEVVESSGSGKTAKKAFYGKVIKVSLTKFTVPKFQIKWENPREASSWFACGDADVTLNPVRKGTKGSRPSPSAGPPTSARQTRAGGKR
jgi:hypothetical protein